MRVVQLHPDGLKLEEVGAPVPGEGEVIVRVHAAAITRGELEWPVDRLPAVPSHELSGGDCRYGRGSICADAVRP